MTLESIDKANEITIFRYRKFPLKSHNVYFSLSVTSPLYPPPIVASAPQLIISLRNRDNDQLVCHWIQDRFMQRLDDMMNWYTHENSGQDQQSYDPWD